MAANSTMPDSHLSDEPIAPASYVGVAGYFWQGSRMPNDGVIFGNSDIRIAEITDGTSNTFAIGERRFLKYCRGAWWVTSSNVQSTNVGGAARVVGYLSVPFNQCNAVEASRGFGSAHPGGRCLDSAMARSNLSRMISITASTRTSNMIRQRLIPAAKMAHMTRACSAFSSCLASATMEPSLETQAEFLALWLQSHSPQSDRALTISSERK